MLFVIDSLAGLVTDLAELFSLWDFFWGLGFVERKKIVSCAGASVRSFTLASDAYELILILDSE